MSFPAPFYLRTLGTPGLHDASGQPLAISTGKPFALLVCLTVQGTSVSREDVAHLLWPASSAPRARHSTRQALSLLRQLLGEDLFAADDPLRLRRGAIETDIGVLEALLADGHVEEALPLWEGTFLPRSALLDAPEWENWLDDTRSRLEHRFASALTRQAGALNNAGEHRRAEACLRKATELQPHFAPSWLALFQVLLEQRDLTGAGEALKDARAALDEGSRELDYAALEERLLTVRFAGVSPLGSVSFRPEFVGRSRELADLLRVWRQAQQGAARLALVAGSTGIGKTRLVEELSRGVRTPDAGLVAVKATEAERRLEWGLATELARQLMGLPGAAGITEGSNRLLRTLLPSLNGLHGMPPVGSIESVALTDALFDLVASVAHEGPLLVVIDDLQWADASSRAVLNRLLRQVRDVPCLVVLTYRSDEIGDELLTLTLAVEPLEESAALVERLHHVTHGNPLFVVELLKAIQEDGVIECDEEQCTLHVARLPDEFPLPHSVQEVIAQRLGRLSESAAHVAAALGHARRRDRLEHVRAECGLGEGEFTRAVGELLEHEVVRWSGSEQLDFAHDQLREAVERRYPRVQIGAAAERKRRVRSRSLAAVLALATVALISLFPVAWGGIGQAVPLPYGGGSIWIQLADGFVELVSSDTTESGWVAREPVLWYPAVASPRVYGPIRTTGGDALWFETRWSERVAPHVVQHLGPGQERIIVRNDPADEDFASVSPHGRYVLYAAQDLEAPQYRSYLQIATLDGQVLKRFPFTGSAEWSPDGRLMAVSIRGTVDTLAILHPEGTRLHSIPFHNAGALAWCGTTSRHVLSLWNEEGLRVLKRLDVTTGTLERIPTPSVVVSSSIACSPGGRAAVYTTPVDGRPALVLQDLETGEWTVLPVGDAQELRAIKWLPDHLPPVVTGVSIEDGPRELQWGERVSLRAAAELCDGSRTYERIEWKSLESGIASVSPNGVLTGNRPGQTRVVASVDGCYADTPAVVVSGAAASGALLQERFERLDSARWLPFGWPTPIVARQEGEPVLSLQGDGMHVDGIVSHRAFALPRGGTLEFEFRLPLTRRDKQDFQACLRQDDREYLEDGTAFHARNTEHVCFGYPVGFLEQFAGDRIAFVTRFAGPTPQLARLFPTDAWTHVALQLRPDGVASLYLNRTHILNSPLPVNTGPDARWRIVISGAAVDTDVLVRNLVLWPELRYRPEGREGK